MEPVPDVPKQKLVAPVSDKRTIHQSIKDRLIMVAQLLWICATLYFRVVRCVYEKITQKLANHQPIIGDPVVITGAGTGLGRQIAIELAPYKPRLILIDSNEVLNNETMEIINKKYADKAKAFKADVSNANDVKQVVQQIIDEYGYVSILINSAAVIAGGSFQSYSNVQYQNIVATNVCGYINMINELLPGMIKLNKGHIVSISSIAGLTPIRKAAVYTGTECAINGIMESLRDEIRKTPSNKIVTTTICPYFVYTGADSENNWNLRIPPINVDIAAKEAVNAIMKKESFCTIPRYWHYFTAINSILPTNIADSFKDVVYTEFK